MNIKRYLFATVLAMVVSFTALWAWVAALPLAFLDPEYPSWRAKQILLKQCDLGDVIVLGDSRAAADIIPALLPIRTTNLAVGGGETIEALAVLRRALACPENPRLVVLSIDTVHFAEADLFWERTVRFGFLSRAELAELRATSLSLHDRSVYEERHRDGIPAVLRDQLYAARFPSFYFSSLAKGGVFLRWWRNNRTLETTIAARGHYFFGTEAGSSVVAKDGKLDSFQPLPVLDRYFDRILALLAEHGIPSVFLAMPLNEATANATRPALNEGFAAYLARYEARYPGFRPIGPTMLVWPDRWFGDAFSHLNPEGAERFSRLLGRCFVAMSAGCDLRWSSAALTAARQE